VRKLLPVLFFLNSWALADQTIEFPASSEVKVHTRETIVDIDKITYRKIEFDHRSYYMQILKPEMTADDLHVLCDSPSGTTEPLVRVGIKVMERTTLFIEGLRGICSQGGQRGTLAGARTSISPDLAVGFALDDKADASFLKVLKHKRFILFPWIGFAAEAP
jgi:hypothetical protein